MLYQSMDKTVSFERRFALLEKELKKDPNNGDIIKELVKLQEEYDSYIKNRI